MSEHHSFTDPVYTARDVAKTLRVDLVTVYRWTRNGTLKEGEDFFVLPHTGTRRSIRFTEAQYHKLLGNRTKS